MGQTSILLVALWLVVGIGGGCRPEPGADSPRYGAAPAREKRQVYRFAVHPLHNPALLFQAYQPLLDYLNRAMPGVSFELEPSRDYGHFENKIRARAPEFLLPNPWQTMIAVSLGYKVIAMAGEPADFKGIFLVRQDSSIRVPADLKGKSVSYPSATALAACIMPQDFLQRHGVKVMQDIDNRYVGSQESAIMNVYLGRTAAGATWPPPWRLFQKTNPREAAELKVIWETAPFINNSVMVRSDVPEVVGQRVRDLLVHLRDSQEGVELLAGLETARFLPAVNTDYDGVQQYIARFEKEVRPVK